MYVLLILTQLEIFILLLLKIVNLNIMLYYCKYIESCRQIYNRFHSWNIFILL